MPSIPSATGRSILLVEEYDALAVAIESALRKFAPHHKTRVVRSLVEARTLAKTHSPELIIVDFDPPHPGAIGFFKELQSALPDSRALIIAAGVTKDLISERGSTGALQFLEKPFELVDFGAAVQALLGPWMDTGTSRGTLRDLALADVAALQCLAGANATLRVQVPGHNGQLHVQKGHIVHAISHNAQGELALIEMLLWGNAHFTEAPVPSAIPKTIHGPWTATLVAAWREAKKRAPAPEKTAVARETAPSPAPSPPKTGAKILVIDDTEMLLIFVEDSLGLAEPNFRITTALTGLHGIKEAERSLPDLILLDYVLPDIKGDEVCRRIAANEKTAHIPVIMMSGHIPEMTAAAEKLPNVVATLAKPFLSEAMVAVVRQTLKEGPHPTATDAGTFRKKSFLLQKETVVTGEEKRATSGGVSQDKKAARAVSTRAESVNPAGHPAIPTSPLSVGSIPGTPEMIMRPQISTAVRQTPMPRSQPTLLSAPTLGPNEVLLDLPLDVVSMQFDTSFQIGSIRARPASPTVAIQIPALAARTALPLATGFRLGPIDLDAKGRISIVRLVPTTQPFQFVTTGTAFEIGGVTIVPANECERLQLMSVAAPNLTMQLFAPLELESVEFSSMLDVRQLVLRCRGTAVRVTLSSQSSSTQSGATFQTTAVTLDEAKRIRELTLAPVN